MDERFTLVGLRPMEIQETAPKVPRARGPVLPAVVLALLVAGCFLGSFFLPTDPAYMDFYHANTPPCAAFLFGTDSLGRDLFSMVWFGGRVSLLIGCGASMVSAVIAVLVGTASGLAPRWLDGLIMRLTEIYLSIPSLLLTVLFQAALGKASVWSLALVIGLTGWAGIAKAVRTEVRKLRSRGYVLAARCMGAGFFHLLWRHLLPNFLPSILFMLVMNLRGAIAAESTLSFLGLGLPLEVVSWGSLLSLAERGLLSGSWWMVVVPGVFLVVTLLCITELGAWLRDGTEQQQSYL